MAIRYDGKKLIIPRSGSWDIYLLLWIRKRSRESREEAGEAEEKREKPLSTESAPSDLGRTIEDLTAKKLN